MLKNGNHLWIHQFIKSSIFIRVDDSSMSCMRALITGPDNTPYDSGCFIFDIYMPSDFPSIPPKSLVYESWKI